MEISSNAKSASMAIEKNQNPGVHFGATSQTALPIQPIWPIFLMDRLNWQCCLAGSSKMDPRILIFFQLPWVPIIDLSLFLMRPVPPNLMDIIILS